MSGWKNVTPFNWQPHELGVMAGRAALALWSQEYCWAVFSNQDEASGTLWVTLHRIGGHGMQHLTASIDLTPELLDDPLQMTLQITQEVCAALGMHVQDEAEDRWAGIQEIQKRVPQD